MAGLCAATELVRSGYDVTVLEATGVAGGRVQTIREPFSQGLWAEAGAMFLNSSHTMTLEYAEHLGLKLGSLEVYATGTSLYYVKGRRIVWPPEAAKRQSVDWPYPLTPAERQMGYAGMMQRYCFGGSALNAPETAGTGWPPGEILHFDQMTFTDFMRMNGASQGAVDLLSVGYFTELGDGPAYCSALMMLYDAQCLSNNPDSMQVLGGNDGYPKAMAKPLSAHIHYGAEVTSISQTADKVVITANSKGRQEQVEGDYAICALPLLVLRNLGVSPPFSPSKQQVVSDMLYTDATRVMLEFSEAFWEKEGLYGLVVTDIEGMVVYPQPSQPGPGGILNVLQCGSGARIMATRSEKERIQFTLKQLTKFYPQAKDYFVRAVTKVWQFDPLAGGSHNWFEPQQMTSWLPAMQQNEGRIYFAGDHVSPYPGWIEGALQTAYAAAREISVLASASAAAAAKGA